MFLRCSTQWNYSEAGPIGMRYESVLAVMAAYNVQDKQGMFDGIRIMERTALHTIRSRK